MDITPEYNLIPAKEKVQTPEIDYQMGDKLGGQVLGSDASSWGSGEEVGVMDENGLYIGSTDHTTAPFWVNMAGAVVAASITITGGNIDGTSTIGGRIASTLATAIDASGHFADDAINTAAGTILGEFAFSGSGAIQIGEYVNGVTGDIKISPTGILGRDKDNATTFSIDATTGVAVLNGLVVGTNVGIGTAEDSAGVTTIVGDVVTTGFVNALSVVAGSIDAVNINVGTLTGFTIQTADSGKRLRMQGSPANEYQFLDGNTKVGHLKIDANASGGYFAQIYIDYLGPVIEVGSVTGASPSVYFNAPFFESYGRSAVGEVGLLGSNTKVGLSWYGGSDATWDFDLGSSLAKISSNVVPSGAYDLGDSSYKWRNLYLSGNITVGGTVDGVNISSHASNASAHHVKTTSLNLSVITINTSKDWNGYSISGAGSIYPDSAYKDLGSSSYKWRDLYVNEIILPVNVGDVTGDLIPTLGNNYELGNSSFKWYRITSHYTTFGDVGFVNDFRIAEEEEGKEGLSVYNHKDEKIMVLDEDGNLWLKGDTKNNTKMKIKFPFYKVKEPKSKLEK